MPLPVELFRARTIASSGPYSKTFEVRIQLDRCFGACLGSLAMMVNIMAGVFNCEATESVLIRSVVAMGIFSAFGWIFGRAADHMVRQSLEANFRMKLQKARESKETVA